MNELKRIVKNLEELKNTSGKKDKILLIKKYCKESGELDDVLRFVIDDRITTGLDLKKIRNEDVEPTENTYSINDVIQYLSKNNTGKHEDVAIVKGFLEKINEEDVSILEQIFTKTLNLGLGCKLYNEAIPNNPIYEHEIQKGFVYEPDKFNKIRKKYGRKFWITEKIDGNRGSYCSPKDYNSDSFELISPNGRIHNGYQHIKDELFKVFGDKFFIDGELEYIDKSGQMTNAEIRQKTSSICSSISSEKTEIGYKIFHILPIKEWEDKKFVTTYEEMREQLDNMDLSGCNYVKVLPVLYEGEDEDMIMKIFKQQRAMFKEGVIVNFDSVYIQGKKDAIVKVKDILDLDLKITGWKYGKENTRLSNCLGALEVELNVDGVNYTVDVGGGFSDSFRKEFVLSPDDYMGKIAEILATEVSKNKEGGVSLSYPRFIEIRTDKTIPDKIISDGKKFKII